jgi:hypothetical protein
VPTLIIFAHGQECAQLDASTPHAWISDKRHGDIVLNGKRQDCRSLLRRSVVRELLVVDHPQSDCDRTYNGNTSSQVGFIFRLTTLVRCTDFSSCISTYRFGAFFCKNFLGHITWSTPLTGQRATLEQDKQQWNVLTVQLVSLRKVVRHCLSR